MNSNMQWNSARIGKCPSKLSDLDNIEMAHSTDRQKEHHVEWKCKCKCSNNSWWTSRKSRLGSQQWRHLKNLAWSIRAQSHTVIDKDQLADICVTMYQWFRAESRNVQSAYRQLQQYSKSTPDDGRAVCGNNTALVGVWYVTHGQPLRFGHKTKQMSTVRMAFVDITRQCVFTSDFTEQ